MKKIIIVICLLVCISTASAFTLIDLLNQRLMIKDLTNIQLYGIKYTSYKDKNAIQFSIIGEVDKAKGFISLSGNRYVDFYETVKEPIYLKVLVRQKSKIKYNEYIILFYDNTQLKVCLPAIKETTTLFISKDGSTYYDKELTQIACEKNKTEVNQS